MQRGSRLAAQRLSDGRQISGLAQGQEVKESVAELGTQAGAVAVFEKILGFFTMLEGSGRGSPHFSELMLVSIAIPCSGDGESGGGFDADFEVLAGRDDGRESRVGLRRPAGSA